MASATYHIEVLSDKDWQDVAEARSLESALAQARKLFSQQKITKARVVTQLGNGMRRIYVVDPAEAAAPPPVYEGWGPDDMLDRLRLAKNMAERLGIMIALGAGIGLVAALFAQVAEKLAVW